MRPLPVDHTDIRDPTAAKAKHERERKVKTIRKVGIIDTGRSTGESESAANDEK